MTSTYQVAWMASTLMAYAMSTLAACALRTVMTDALTSLSLRNFRCSHQGARCALIFPFFFAALGRLDYRLRQVFRLFSVS